MFWIAFAIGAGVLWLFAQDQFNHPSWKDDDRLTRILSVPHLRGDRVRKRALFVYFVLLLAASTRSSCSSAARSSRRWTSGVASPQSMAGGAAAQPLALPGPAVPFAVSLAMVGIAPRIELLTQDRGEDPGRRARDDGAAARAAVVRADDRRHRADARADRRSERQSATTSSGSSGTCDAAGTVFGTEAGKVQAVREAAAEAGRLQGLGDRRDLAGEQGPRALRGARGELRHRHEPPASPTSTTSRASRCEGMTPTERDRALQALGRPDERDERPLAARSARCSSSTSRSRTPPAGAEADPIRRSISDFFERATAGRTTSPELDIAVKSILGAVAVAGGLGLPRHDAAAAVRAVAGQPRRRGAGRGARGAVPLRAGDRDRDLVERAGVGERHAAARDRHLAPARDRHRLLRRVAGVPRGPQRLPGRRRRGERDARRDPAARLRGAADRGADGDAGGAAGAISRSPISRSTPTRSMSRTRARWRAIALNVAAMVLLAVVVDLSDRRGLRDGGAVVEPGPGAAADAGRLRGESAGRRAGGADHRAGDDLGARPAASASAGSRAAPREVPA